MNITPVHKKGKKNDLDYSVSLQDEEKARDCFKRACKRLLNPPVWHELCGPLSANFRLVDDNGVELKRLSQVNDRFKIDITGAPGNKMGDGYDWVIVEAIEDHTNEKANEESFGMRVRSGSNPQKDDITTAHFFKSNATSSFEIVRKGTTVSACYHGRNEVPNTDTGDTLNNIRNAFVATAGFMGLSDVQWLALLKGLLQEEIGG